MKKAHIVILTILLLGIFTTSFGQNEANKMAADRTLQGGGRVNPSTLAMEFDLPLGSYPGRGINVPIGLSYSSKQWRMNYLGNNPVPGGNYSSCYPQYYLEFGEDTASGWTTSLATPQIEYIGLESFYNSDGTGFSYNDVTCPESGGGPGYYPQYYIRRILVRLPSGETHEMRPDDSPTTANAGNAATWDLTYYAVDGSNLKYIQNSASGVYRLLMPDGSFYDFDGTYSGAANRKAVKFTDRNGNFTTYYGPGSMDNNGVTHPHGYWKDTLGRNISIPMSPTAPSIPTTAGNPQIYSMPGLNGTSPVQYKLHWKKLKGTSAAESGLTNFSDNLKYAGDRYLCNNPYPTFCHRPAGTYLFGDGYALIMSTELFNPIVLTEIELPTGQKYKFSYDIYGRMEKISYPTGGEEKFTYSVVPTLSTLEPGSIGGQTNFGVTNRKLYEISNGNYYEWTYQAGYVAPQGYKVSITNPDQTQVERFLYRGNDYGSDSRFGYDNGLAGMQYEQRVFDNASPRKMVSRSLTHWTTSKFTIAFNYQADWHPRVTHEETHIYEPSGNGDKVWATMKYEYEDLSSRDKPLLRKKSSQYEYQASSGSSLAPEDPDELPDPNPTPVPTPVPPNLIRTAETTYLIYDSNYLPATIDIYKNQNMIGLATASVVKDASGNVVSRSEMKYDESGYSPNVGRGNPTSSRVWDSTKGVYTDSNAYITTRAKFDTYGNQYESTDALNNTTVTTYDATHHAYPIKVTSAVPDPSGTKGSNTAFETETTFDFVTGLPVSTKDVNGQVSTIEYKDPLLRPTRITSPNGAETLLEYGNQNGKWVKTKTQINENNWKEVIAYADGLGRPIRSESVESGGSIFTETEYDSAGRIKRKSSPYKEGETIYWTETIYDEASRAKELITPDGAKIIKNYGLAILGNHIGTSITVTDQAGKVKRVIKNSLDKITRVDEPNGAGQLGSIDNPNQPTIYEYDTLDSLKKVTQDSQIRTFVYDSLSRLQQATNPESGTINYQYDNNGKLTQAIDARNITTSYQYDNIGRLVDRSYSDGTPAVTYKYDDSLVQFSKGKLTKMNSSVSTTEYTSFDNMGRVISHKQITNGQSYFTSYNYDITGALIEQTYPSGRVVKNVLDNNGDISAVQSKKNQNSGFWNYAHHFTYSSSGLIESMQLGNGRWESTQFNTRLQPTQISLGITQNSTNLLKLNYDYGTTDNNGNIKSQILTVPSVGNTNGFTATQTYTYDSLNRLKDAKEIINSNQTWKQTFNYDRHGNRRFDTTNNNTTTLASGCPQAICNPTIDINNNRFTSGQGYNYDLSGNTTQDAENRQFIYDGENKQIEVKDSNGNTIGQYFYDGDGRRVRKYITATQETTIFVYNASGQLVAEYSNQISQTPQVSYLTTDHLGSPRVITNQTGKVTSRRDFHPFGEEIISTERNQELGYTVDNIKQKFTGYQRDSEIGLDYAQARYFSYEHGRFTSPDDFLNDTRISDPMSWNLYVYGRNNPLKYVDPTGEIIQVSFTDEEGSNVTLTYRDGKLYNADGSEYVGNNRYALNALNYINSMRRDPVLRGMINDLDKSKKVYTIQKDANNPTRNEFVPTKQGGNVYWSGEEYKDKVETLDGKEVERTTSAIEILAHELLGHGWFYDAGKERIGQDEKILNGSQNNYIYIKLWEVDATNIQNRVRKLEGLDPSLNFGHFIPTPEFYIEDFDSLNTRPRSRPELKGGSPMPPQQKPVLKNKKLYRVPGTTQVVTRP